MFDFTGFFLIMIGIVVFTYSSNLSIKGFFDIKVMYL